MTVNKSFHRILTISCLLSLSMACSIPTKRNAPTTTPNLDQTAVVETIIVQLTRTAQSWTVVPPAATEGIGTDLSQLTATSTSTNEAPPAQATTNSVQTCNVAQFVTDVSVPDGTDFSPGSGFIKTWRLKNNGTCTWNSSYQVVYYGGDQMAAPATSPLTGGTVPPGGTVDISLSMTAPGSDGSFTGYYRIQAPDGSVFGVGSAGTASFYVMIDVVSGPAPAEEEPVAEPPAALPDLIINQFTITPATPTADVPCHVRIQTYNQGNAPAGAYVVRWWGLSTAASPGCQWNVPSTNAKGGRVLECDYTFQSWYPINKTSLATTDATGMVAESNEDNNSATISPFGVNP